MRLLSCLAGTVTALAVGLSGLPAVGAVQSAGTQAVTGLTGETQTVSFRGASVTVPADWPVKRDGRPARLRADGPAGGVRRRPEPGDLPGRSRRPGAGRPPHDAGHPGRHRSRPGGHLRRLPGRGRRQRRRRRGARAGDRRLRHVRERSGRGGRARLGHRRPCARRLVGHDQHGQHLVDDHRGHHLGRPHAVGHHLHRPGLRRLHRALPDRARDLVHLLALQGGEHVHRRHQPGLLAAQPQRLVGERRRRPGLGADPDLRRAAGTCTTTPTGSTRRPRPRRASRRRTTPWHSSTRSASASATRCGSTWRPSPTATRRAGRRCSTSSTRGVPSCATAATSRASTAARARRSARSCRRCRRPASTCPDQLWIARWCSQPYQPTCYNGTNDPEVPDTLWADHQRIRQYLGGHQETWGGVTINIDSNTVDASLAPGTAGGRRRRSSPSAAGRSSTGWPAVRRSSRPPGSRSVSRRRRSRRCRRASSTRCAPSRGPAPSSSGRRDEPHLPGQQGHRVVRPVLGPVRRAAAHGDRRPGRARQRRHRRRVEPPAQREADGATHRAEHLRHDGRPGALHPRGRHQLERGQELRRPLAAGPLGRLVRRLDPAGRLAGDDRDRRHQGPGRRLDLLRPGARPQPGRAAVRLDRRPLPRPCARRPAAGPRRPAGRRGPSDDVVPGHVSAARSARAPR